MIKTHIFSNGLKLIYKKRESNLTSICVSIDGGACKEREIYGLAHATEHMVFKGTNKRSEEDINKEFSKLFGFSNAMTNYPYVIYYGTLLEEDFREGIDLISDVIINPRFSKDGFREEMLVIKEELKEWDEELEQFTEDRLFFNALDNRRIKHPIIGKMEDLDRITLKDLKEFYRENYNPKTAAIAVISGMNFDEVKFKVWQKFSKWENKVEEDENLEYGDFKSDVFTDYRDGIEISKIQIIFKIDSLSFEEIRALRILNEIFSEGVNSILYTNLRTKNGLIYDVIPRISHEKSIKLYKITLGTGKENKDRVLKVVEDSIIELLDKITEIKETELLEIKKSFKIKRLFREEQSIVLAKELSTYETMFRDYSIYTDEEEKLESVSKEDLINVYNKIINLKSIQIVEKK